MSTVDALVVTALQEEYEAAAHAAIAGYGPNPGVTEWTPGDKESAVPYVFGQYVLANKASLKVALARPTRMGATTTIPIAASLSERLQPQCLAMCGVCAGNPAEVALGDVVFAELAYTYDEGKRMRAGFVPDHRQFPMTDRWLRAAQDMSSDDLPSYGELTQQEAELWILEQLYIGADPQRSPARPRYFPAEAWRERLRALITSGLVEWHGPTLALTALGRISLKSEYGDEAKNPDRLPFTVAVGPIASGNVVVKDGLTWEKLRAMGVRNVHALDMEAAGIAATAHKLGVREWAVAKGVMDYADPRKNDRYKTFAALASAEVLWKFLTQQLSDELRDGATSPASDSQTVVGEVEAARIHGVALGADLDRLPTATAKGIVRAEKIGRNANVTGLRLRREPTNPES